MSFSPRLNVIVGDNGTGKSQLLKLLYLTSAAAREAAPDTHLTKSSLNRAIAAKLLSVFRPEKLGRLANRVQGRTRAEVSVKWEGIGGEVAFHFATNSRTEVTTTAIPSRPLEGTPVYIPTHELMSIYPGFVSLYNERALEFDETWRDTADFLGRPPLRGRRTLLSEGLLQPIEEVLGGSLSEDQGRFYLHQQGVGNLEMHLVDEGLRKLAMILRLAQSGTLVEGGYMFWDEPEANLNPATIRPVAQVIRLLAQAGVQVFVATHSTFLLRELDLERDQDGVDETRVIALRRGPGGVAAEEAPSMDELNLDSVKAFEAEMDQTDRFLRS